MLRVGVWGREGSRMTGSACNAMDVLYIAIAYVKGSGLGKGWQSEFS